MSTIFTLWRLDCYKMLANKYAFITLFLIGGIAMLVTPASLYLCSIVFSYFLGITLISLDEQYHSNYLYGRIAASRKKIVLARFLLYFVQTAVFIAIFAIVSYLSPFKTETTSILLPMMLISFSLALIFLGFSQALAFYFKFSTVRLVSLAFYVLCFMLFSTFHRWVDLSSLATLLFSGTTLVCFAVLFFVTCLFFALKLYSHKQFMD